MGAEQSLVPCGVCLEEEETELEAKTTVPSSNSGPYLDSSASSRSGSGGSNPQDDGARAHEAHEAASEAGRYQLRGKAQSEGVIDSWGHRDVPAEIDRFYEMRQQIGEGTTSKVFMAVRRADGFPFAVKVVDKRALSKDPQVRYKIINQLRKEIEVLQLLDHPNIIHYYTKVETSEKIFILMEYLEGGELYDHLYTSGPLPAEDAAELLAGISSAVDHMHEHGVVHRDIKAENLMLVALPPQTNHLNHGSSASKPGQPQLDGQPLGQSRASTRRSAGVRLKLIDFGFSTVLPLGGPTHSFLGTAGYLAPEIRMADRSYYKGVDIWALGVLTYLVLTCRLPFDREVTSLPKRQVRGQFELTFPEAEWAQMPHAVRELVRGMLEIEPAQRFNAPQCLRHPFMTGELFGRDFAAESDATRQGALDNSPTEERRRRSKTPPVGAAWASAAQPAAQPTGGIGAVVTAGGRGRSHPSSEQQATPPPAVPSRKAHLAGCISVPALKSSPMKFDWHGTDVGIDLDESYATPPSFVWGFGAPPANHAAEVEDTASPQRIRRVAVLCENELSRTL